MQPHDIILLSIGVCIGVLIMSILFVGREK
jgi:hypothetical protein